MTAVGIFFVVVVAVPASAGANRRFCGKLSQPSSPDDAYPPRVTGSYLELLGGRLFRVISDWLLGFTTAAAAAAAPAAATPRSILIVHDCLYPVVDLSEVGAVPLPTPTPPPTVFAAVSLLLALARGASTVASASAAAAVPHQLQDRSPSSHAQTHARTTGENNAGRWVGGRGERRETQQHCFRREEQSLASKRGETGASKYDVVLNEKKQRHIALCGHCFQPSPSSQLFISTNPIQSNPIQSLSCFHEKFPWF